MLDHTANTAPAPHSPASDSVQPPLLTAKAGVVESQPPLGADVSARTPAKPAHRRRRHGVQEPVCSRPHLVRVTFRVRAG